jgi:4-amino-4-deoxy-L-arabinose transferase-like glycosyltransferase
VNGVVAPGVGPATRRAGTRRTGPGSGPGRLALHTALGRRTALGLLLAAAGLLYSIGLSGSGWANAYYSAAAQAGAQSWQAFFFGALDPAGGITVDKPPAALWLISLSVRVLGLSTPALLLPQALCAVAAVGLLYATVRRQALALSLGGGQPEDGAPSPPGVGTQARESRAVATGLLAGAILALTPAVTLLARYDNPDVLMVLLSVGAAYALTRSVEKRTGGGGWLVVAGLLLGLAFLTKLLQAWLVVPAFVAVAVVAGAGPLRAAAGSRDRSRSGDGRRRGLVGPGRAAHPARSPALDRRDPGQQRPGARVGLQRARAAHRAGGRRRRSRSGATRGLVPADWVVGAGGQLAPAGRPHQPHRRLVADSRARPPRCLRAGLLLWGGWLLVAGAVLSSLRGISHSYYAIQLAPAIAGGTALGGALLWERAHRPAARRPRALMAAGVALTAAWSTGLLLSRPSWPLVVAPVVLAAAAIAVLDLCMTTARTWVAGPSPDSRTLSAAWSRTGGSSRHAPGRPMVVGALLVALLAGPAAWSVATSQAVHRGANVHSGPGVTVIHTPVGYAPGTTLQLPAAVVGRRAADLQLASDVPVWSLGGFSGNDPHPTLDDVRSAVTAGRVHYLLVGSRDAAHGSAADHILRWVSGSFPSTRVANWVVFDLTAGGNGR